MGKIILSVFILALYGVYLIGQASASEPSELSENIPLNTSVSNELVQMIESLRISQNTPGISVTTFTSSGEQFSYGSGHLDHSQTNAVSPSSTLFPVASVTKTFTAVAILQLVKNGVIGLDTKLAELNSALFHQVAIQKCPQSLAHLKEITVSHLLSHSSGIKRDLSNVNLWWDAKALQNQSYPTRHDFINNFCQESYLYSPGDIPGKSKYSNLGFNLLAQIVAAYGGERSYEEYVKKHIFQKLGLNNSFYGLTPQQAENLTVSHGKAGSLKNGLDNEPTPLAKVLKPGSYAGSIGLVISSRDLGRFGRSLLNWTTTTTSSDELGLNWEDALIPAVENSKSISRGNGFHLYRAKTDAFSFFSNGFLCYGHTGLHYGSKALIYVCPEINWGIALVTNARDSKRNEYMYEIGQILANHGILKKVSSLPPQTESWIQNVSAFQAGFTKEKFRFPKSVLPRINFSDYPTQEYLGIYHSDTDGPFEIKESDNGKLLFLGSELVPDLFIKDRFYNNDYNTYGHTGEPVDFVRDRQGNVVKIIGYEILHANKIGSTSSSYSGSCSSSIL